MKLKKNDLTRGRLRAFQRGIDIIVYLFFIQKFEIGKILKRFYLFFYFIEKIFIKFFSIKYLNLKFKMKFLNFNQGFQRERLVGI